MISRHVMPTTYSIPFSFYYVLGVGQYIVLRPVCLTPTSSSCCTRLLLLRLRQHPPIYRPLLLHRLRSRSSTETLGGASS